MPTTSNFGWTTPADTDLVKDGAAAIRTLGNGIDTSLLDLKGGTTGQILSKASNTDLDYTWINNDQGDLTGLTAGVGITITSATGPVPTITNSSTDLITTAGDVLYGTAADTVARLGIGTAGQVLTVNSGATAPEWKTPGGAANWSLVNAGGTALTGASTITVSGISNADKIMLLVIGSGMSSASASSVISFRLNADTGSNYNYSGFYIAGFSTYGANILQSHYGTGTSVTLAKMSGSASSVGAGYVLLSGCSTSGVKVFNSAGGFEDSGSNSQENYVLGGYYDSASAITSISLISSVGNFDRGTLYVYTSA